MRFIVKIVRIIASSCLECHYTLHPRSFLSRMLLHPVYIVASSLFFTDGDFELGQWQGIYYCEHRDGQRTRNVVVTLNGALKS